MNQILSFSGRATRRSICYIAAWSRLLVFISQAVFNILPDHQADVFKPKIGKPHNSIDDVLRMIFDGFVKWDSQYILYVSEHGYNLEQTFAFFPLLPLAIRYTATIFTHFAPFLSFYTCCIMCAALINFMLFIGAAVFLFELTQNIFGSPKFASLTAILFSFNPASIFFSSCYTESLFSFCVFRALLLLSNRNTDDVVQEMKSALWFMLGGASRSNGTVNCGFILYHLIRCTVQKWQTNFFTLSSLFLLVFKSFCFCSLIISPFLVVNWYGYYKYCICSGVFTDRNCEIPKWCEASFPSIYNHVQKDIWGLGLFSYYQWRKLPNFFLATPVIVLSLSSTYLYFADRKNELMHLGLLISAKESRTSQYIFTSKCIFQYQIHLLFLLIFSMLFMYVEVTTRMILSSSPVIYWTVASFILKDLTAHDVTSLSISSWSKLGRTSKSCLYFFVIYFVLGILLHCNFYPWT